MNSILKLIAILFLGGVMLLIIAEPLFYMLMWTATLLFK